MKPIEIVAQIIGIAALVCAICSFQQNNHKKILFFQILSGTLFTIHFTLMGATLGGVLNFFGMLRSIVFYNKDKKWVQGTKWLYIFSGIFITIFLRGTSLLFPPGLIRFIPLFPILIPTACIWGIVFYNKDKNWAEGVKWLYIFSATFIITGIVFWEGYISLFPMVSMVISTVCFWVTNPKKVRLLMLPASPLWMVYNLINKSIGGFLTETFVLCSVIVGMIRFDRKA